MGKLAGREFTYHSDLDLVFLHPGDASELAAASRVGQRLVGQLTTMTGAGVAYTVDARLRPSGHQGALVTTFEGFEHYQLEQAQTWEHLALLRSRVIAGDGGRGHAGARAGFGARGGREHPLPAPGRGGRRGDREDPRELPLAPAGRGAHARGRRARRGAPRHGSRDPRGGGVARGRGPGRRSVPGADGRGAPGGAGGVRTRGRRGHDPGVGFLTGSRDTAPGDILEACAPPAVRAREAMRWSRAKPPQSASAACAGFSSPPSWRCSPLPAWRVRTSTTPSARATPCASWPMCCTRSASRWTT